MEPIKKPEEEEKPAPFYAKYFAMNKEKKYDADGFPIKKAEEMKPPVPLTEEHLKMPHEMYNWVVFKCFDACVGTFRDKKLVINET